MANLIGGGADQVSTNGMLGTAAFVDVDQLPIPGSITTALAAKQDALVSGTNIKTVNSVSLLGSGNISIAGGGALVLLATITPTASANIDALNVFTSTYDDYLILGNGINFATDDGVNLRLANAGVVDVAGNYVQTTANSGASASFLAVSTVTNATVRSAGKGAAFEVFVRNVNDASRMKLISSASTWNSTTGGSADYTSLDFRIAYAAASTVSGFRLLSAIGGNFAAQGSIKVYGIAKV